VNTQETAVMLRVLRSVWPNTEINADTVKAYEWALEDISAADGERAVRTWMRTGKFFPKPAELRELVSRAVLGPDELAEAAWVEVQREIRRVGFNRLPVYRGGRMLERPARRFSSPLIAQAVDSVGWDVLCMSEQPAEVRKQFIFTFRALHQRDISALQRGDLDQATALASGPVVRELAG
jgi:hypothetical protein